MRLLNKIFAQVLLTAVCCTMLSGCHNEEFVGGKTDPTLVVKITPITLVLQEKYKSCDALAVQWEWTSDSPYRDNDEVEFTLELAKAGTDFFDSHFEPLGEKQQKIFTVKELNEMLVTNGVVGNGEKELIEARLAATIDSYNGVRSEATSFEVQTYYIDPNDIPPYERIWFVGSFTDWKFVEMKQNIDNPFQFYIDITLNDDGVNEFKFGTDQTQEGKWWNMYKAPYANAPITESRVVQVRSDIVNDFKWRLKPEECGKTYHIVLDITPDEERMYCTESDVDPDTPVEPEDPDEPDTPIDPDEPDTPIEPEPDVDPFSVRIEAADCEFGCPGDEGSVIIDDGIIKGINYWRKGYIDIVVKDVPEEGNYYLISGIQCWKLTDYSFKVTTNDIWSEVQIVTPTVVNSTFEYKCVIPLIAGDNLITISGGNGINDGFAPNFKYFIISNGASNYPGGGAEGDNQGEFGGE